MMTQDKLAWKPRIEGPGIKEACAKTGGCSSGIALGTKRSKRRRREVARSADLLRFDPSKNSRRVRTQFVTWSTSQATRVHQLPKPTYYHHVALPNNLLAHMV